MNASIIYFDNAATTFPKPDEVYIATDNALRRSGNSGRGAHALAMAGARTVFDCRESIADFLGASHSERLIFTPGCTYSINMVLHSFCATLSENSTVLISGLEHNAVMRPLTRAQNKIKFAVQAMPYRPGAFCDLNDLKTALQALRPALFVLTEGSNVTGEVADISKVAPLCESAGVPLLVDAAQTAGRNPGCLSQSGITFWCASAHKGLMGPQGLGLLHVNPNYELDAFVAGGTGSSSELLDMPDSYPDHLEPGTTPAFLIAGLSAGVQWLRSTRVAKVIEHENALLKHFLDWSSKFTPIETYGLNALSSSTLSNSSRLPTVSFSIRDKSPEVVADALQCDANIAVRSGLHCSVMAHRALGTETSGLVRVSFGYFNTMEQVDLLTQQLERLAK